MRRNCSHHIAAEHETAFLRLTEIKVSSSKSYDVIDKRLNSFGDERLQNMAFDRQT